MAKRKSKPTKKRTPHGRSKAKAPAVRSKNNPTKTPRTKRLARVKPKKLSRRNAPAGRKTKPKGQPSRRANRNSTPDRSRKTRTTGYTSRIKITNSVKKELQNMTLKKSETTLKSKSEIKLSRSKSKAKEVIKTLLPYASKKLKSLGKSKNNLRMVKLKYKYKLNGKTFTSYFSKTLESFTTKEQLEIILKETVEGFEKNLKKYHSSGMADIRISGVRIHAYED